MDKIVGIIGTNSEEYIKSILRCWDNAETPALIEAAIPDEMKIEYLHKLQIKKCYIEERNMSVNMEGVEIINLRRKKKEFVLKEEIYKNFDQVKSKGNGIILFSSGSMGWAKPIFLAQKAILGNANAIMNCMGITSNDKLCIVKNINHSSTFTGELMVGLLSQAEVLVFPNILSINKLVYSLMENNVTFLCINQTILRMIVESIEKRKEFLCIPLKKIFVSGSVLSETLLEKARKILPHVKIYNMYGLTEMGPRVTMQTEEHMIGNSCGIPLEGVKVKICNEEGSTLEAEQKGIIYVKSKYRMNLYIWNKDCFDKDGWFNTRDLGYIDKQGELFVLGRMDNMFTIYSHNVYPEEIEKIVLLNDMVSECVVFGKKDKTGENKLICCVVMKDKRQIETLILELKKMFIKKLAKFEIPTRISIVEFIPKTANGKIDRKKCKKYFG